MTFIVRLIGFLMIVAGVVVMALGGTCATVMLSVGAIGRDFGTGVTIAILGGGLLVVGRILFNLDKNLREAPHRTPDEIVFPPDDGGGPPGP